MKNSKGRTGEIAGWHAKDFETDTVPATGYKTRIKVRRRDRLDRMTQPKPKGR